MENINRSLLYQQFQEQFPLESLNEMPLEKYTNLNREDSFCYWIESRTHDLGSFWGGSSYKFGIYKYNKRPDDTRILSDDNYAWYKKYGKKNAEDAYSVVLEAVIKVATFARNKEFREIEKISELGDSFKWKIAFLYSEEYLIPVYKKEMLQQLATHFGMANANQQDIYHLQMYLIHKKGDKELYTYYEELLEILEKHESEVPVDDVKRYWLYAPGEGAKKWELCKSNNLVCIAWDELGELTPYQNKEEVQKDLQTIHNKPDSSFKNDALAVWEFSHVMKPGDVIYVKGGQYKLLGRGIITSDYKYDSSFDEYNNIHEVEWTHKGEWQVDKPLALKTLTDMTKYPDDVKNYEEIITHKSDSNSDEVPFNDRQYWWLVCNPKIWSIQSLGVGETIEYSLYSDTGAPRKIFQNFIDARKGDLVISYESTPTKQIVALAEVERASDGKTIVFKKTEALDHPIEYSVVKNLSGLENMQFLANPLGTFFKLTNDEYDILMEEIQSVNGASAECPKYTASDFLREVYMDSSSYEKLVKLLLTKKNVILQGAPGVGKTFSAKRLAYSIMGKKDESKIELVQFHQNYSYEDFVMGYKPNENGGFELKKGVFYNFCRRASYDKHHKYFFIIDEINRGNLSKVFGELMMLIEKDYRGTAIKLAYSDELFSVPSNVYILGMMNTADRSLAMIDYALRRRFSFFDMKPGFDTSGFHAYRNKLDDGKFGEVINAIEGLNKIIADDASLGPDFCIGHSYFCGQETVDKLWLQNVVEYDIIPMLREYWFDNNAKFKQESDKLKSIVE